MRLYLDDERATPQGFDARAFTADEAIEVLSFGEVAFVSLDYDLAMGGTGYDVACWIERAVAEGRITMPVWTCHSANPSGRERIEAAMRSAERFNDERREGGSNSRAGLPAASV